MEKQMNWFEIKTDMAEVILKKTQELESELKDIRERIDNFLIDTTVMRFMDEEERETWDTLSSEIYRNFYTFLADVFMLKEQAEKLEDKK